MRTFKSGLIEKLSFRHKRDYFFCNCVIYLKIYYKPTIHFCIVKSSFQIVEKFCNMCITLHSHVIYFEPSRNSSVVHLCACVRGVFKTQNNLTFNGRKLKTVGGFLLAWSIIFRQLKMAQQVFWPWKFTFLVNPLLFNMQW